MGSKFEYINIYGMTFIYCSSYACLFISHVCCLLWYCSTVVTCYAYACTSTGFVFTFDLLHRNNAHCFIVQFFPNFKFGCGLCHIPLIKINTELYFLDKNWTMRYDPKPLI